ncbi:type II toxin-antitoxin system HicB family antitoxin [Methanoregula sp.]|uniref:type II toxin-antitoxin system HicB family antitoxin n=1 Tax=Methanoregula sp. TaxID=2052170 RepID=UPI00236D7DBA|nr:type II toxin-antitoxin system HicB family antitoxin [Methanoregula sp.]MDD1687907.1 type II toxin-antitoxin system HicB family antitoxin [Methanoregula sp.]
MKFSILIEQDEDGRYVVECTDLPGCMTEGDTLNEAIENINEAIVGCIKSRLKTASDKIHITSLPSRMSIDVDTSGINYA